MLAPRISLYCLDSGENTFRPFGWKLKEKGEVKEEQNGQFEQKEDQYE